jgi:hypothetical protein
LLERVKRNRLRCLPGSIRDMGDSTALVCLCGGVVKQVEPQLRSR